MAEAVLNCSICLDLLKVPVTIPCGHSYCLSCIESFWDQNQRLGEYDCPQCRYTFIPRPALNKNTMLSELAEELKKKKLQTGRPACPDCDICTGSKHKAVKSCLVCLASYCENHIQSHYESPALQKHQLVEAAAHIQEKICSQHNKLLEIFCQTDQKFICYLCLIDEHSGHKTVSVAAERSEKQKQLTETQRESQHKIQQKEKKVQELKQDMDSLKFSVQSAVNESDRIFKDLMDFIRKSHSELKGLFRSLEKTQLSLAEDLLRTLEQDLSDQRRRSSRLEQLSNTDNHIYFLQTFQSLCIPDEPSELPSVMINPKLSIEDLRKVVSEVKEELFCKLQVFKTTRVDCLLFPEPKTREDFMKYWCRLTLDPNTVNNMLCLSDENRKATVIRRARNYPAHPERFDFTQQILCRESLSGRCYWEVEILLKYGYTIAVSYKSINRKMQSAWSQSNESKFGYNDQSWGLSCVNSVYTFVHNNKEIKLPVESVPSRIGVYLDHSAGSLSFYSVSDTMSLLHKVETTFTQPLYAGFQIHLYDNFIQICDLKQSCFK